MGGICSRPRTVDAGHEVPTEASRDLVRLVPWYRDLVAAVRAVPSITGHLVR
jgi:hypothetical protein